MICLNCNQEKHSSTFKTAVVGGVYFKHICNDCLSVPLDGVSSIAASHERNRQYEDNAQDTIQPYDAAGANPEFLRLYPDAAKKTFSPEVIEQLKRKL